MGGSLGSFLAQRTFRHKISKASYQQNFRNVLLGQVRNFTHRDISLLCVVICDGSMFLGCDVGQGLYGMYITATRQTCVLEP